MTEQYGALKDAPLARLAETGPDTACRFIETLIAAAFGLPVRDVRGPGRGTAAAAFARQVAMYLAHVGLGMSLSSVGRHFHRDRTTVAHACACIEDRRDGASMDRLLEALEAALARWRRDIERGQSA
jgi:chromosomal replication initiation ATPase DnaA